MFPVSAPAVFSPSRLNFSVCSGHPVSVSNPGTSVPVVNFPISAVRVGDLVSPYWTSKLLYTPPHPVQPRPPSPAPALTLHPPYHVTAPPLPCYTASPLQCYCTPLMLHGIPLTMLHRIPLPCYTASHLPCYTAYPYHVKLHPLTMLHDIPLPSYTATPYHLTRQPPNSKQRFTTSFLRGRCRKAALGVCSSPLPRYTDTPYHVTQHSLPCYTAPPYHVTLHPLTMLHCTP